MVVRVTAPRERRVVGDDVARVSGAVAGVPDLPTEIDARVEVEKGRRPSTHPLEHAPSHHYCSLPERNDVAATRSVAYAETGDPFARERTTSRVDYSRLNCAKIMRGPKQPRDALERVVFGEAGIVVQEKQQLPSHLRDACIAAGRRTDILWQGKASCRLRQSVGLPAVTHHHHVDVDPVLAPDRLDRAAKLVWPPSSGNDHTAVGGLHVSRLESKVVASWAAVAKRAGTSTFWRIVYTRPNRRGGSLAAL